MKIGSMLGGSSGIQLCPGRLLYRDCPGLEFRFRDLACQFDVWREFCSVSDVNSTQFKIGKVD